MNLKLKTLKIGMQGKLKELRKEWAENGHKFPAKIVLWEKKSAIYDGEDKYIKGQIENVDNNQYFDIIFGELPNNVQDIIILRIDVYKEGFEAKAKCIVDDLEIWIKLDI